jgi:cytochrome c oxidase assembly protein subunit 15
MSATFAETRLAPRWLHGWAVLTAAATVALLALGAVVTTFQVGMADPVWPTLPWHLALIDWSEPNPGFVIEHTHRLAGYIVGCCVIVLAGGLLASARRPWLKVLGIAALGGVIAQGLLGGFRVVLNARLGMDLAVVHGCFAQVVFSLLVTLAVLTAARPSGAMLPAEETLRLRRWSLALTAVVFLQLVWGALVRHTNGALAQRLHVMTAFAVVAVAVWLARTALANPAARQLLGRTLIVLGVLLVLQVMLGVESWMGKFARVLLPEMHKPTVGQAATRVAHVLVGSFILAASVVLTVRAYQPAAEAGAATEESHEAGTETSYRPAAGLTGITNVVHHLEGTA